MSPFSAMSARTAAGPSGSAEPSSASAVRIPQVLGTVDSARRGDLGLGPDEGRHLVTDFVRAGPPIRPAAWPAKGGRGVKTTLPLAMKGLDVLEAQPRDRRSRPSDGVTTATLMARRNAIPTPAIMRPPTACGPSIVSERELPSEFDGPRWRIIERLNHRPVRRVDPAGGSPALTWRDGAFELNALKMWPITCSFCDPQMELEGLDSGRSTCVRRGVYDVPLDERHHARRIRAVRPARGQRPRVVGLREVPLRRESAVRAGSGRTDLPPIL